MKIKIDEKLINEKMHFLNNFESKKKLVFMEKNTGFYVQTTTQSALQNELNNFLKIRVLNSVLIGLHIQNIVGIKWNKN